MSLRPPSLQSEIDFISATDAAIASPADDADDATRKEFARKLEVARETGDYSSLLVSGKQPRKFVLRNIHPRVVWKVKDRVMDKERHDAIGPNEMFGTVFLLALVSVSDIDVKQTTDPSLGKMASDDVLFKVTEAVAHEVGIFAWQRAQAIAPKP